MCKNMPLMYHGSRLSWQIVSQIAPYNIMFLSLYEKCLDWNILSRRVDIDWILVKKTKDILPWVFTACSKNKSLTLDVLHSMPDAEWNEKRISKLFKLRPDYLSKFLPAVVTIQRYWLQAYYDPNHASGVCKRRLQRHVEHDNDYMSHFQK